MTVYTPVFGWPYQALLEPPDGPNLGEDLALAIEATMQNLQSRVQQVEQSVAVLNVATYQQRLILPSAVASVTLSGIPTNLRYLTARCNTRGDAAVQAQLISIQIGGDVGVVYKYSYSQMQNTVFTGVSGSGTSAVVGIMTGASAPGTAFSELFINFASWDQTSPFLGWDASSGAFGINAANQFVYNASGEYFNTNARTSITFLPQAGNFIAGCDFQLFGLPA